GLEDTVSQIYKTPHVSAGKPDDAQGPIHKNGFDVFKVPEGKILDWRRSGKIGSCRDLTRGYVI
ncbi:MAG: hypothetical protein IIV93_02880, partial [Clostridia bacterium]|nr:hypothetical protein [Clostridia bacterium]